MNIKGRVAAAGLAAVLLAGPAMAQQEGLVNVNITDVEVLKNVGIAVDVGELQAPVTVQVPVGIAAQVCPNVDANVLAQNKGDQTAACDVGSVDQTNQAFNNLLQRNKSSIEQQIAS